MKNFTIDYFVEKFSAIPSEKIGEGSIYDHCALWYCGVTIDRQVGGYAMTDEARALAEIFRPALANINPLLVLNSNADDIVSDVNDRDLFGAKPKERILNALQRAKELIKNP